MRPFWIFCLALAALPCSHASAIGTYRNWDGTQEVFGFGCPGNTTYGQVITIPVGMNHLTKFTFSWANSQGSGSMVVRGEVYAWRSGKASGNSLYESAPRTISFGDGSFHKENFATAGLTVTPGAKYVIFASIDKDYEQCTNSYNLGWGWIEKDVYHEGAFVYQDNEGDELRWTTKRWKIHPDVDLAFKAVVGP